MKNSPTMNSGIYMLVVYSILKNMLDDIRSNAHLNRSELMT
jgi:hypothetical protein